MDTSKNVSSIVRFYKFKEFIGNLAINFGLETGTQPEYQKDYILDGDKLGVIVKTDLGGKFLAYIAKSCEAKT